MCGDVGFEPIGEIVARLVEELGARPIARVAANPNERASRSRPSFVAPREEEGATVPRIGGRSPPRNSDRPGVTLA